MTDNRYAAAGWAAILSAVGSLAMLGLSFAFDFAKLAPGRGPRMPVPWSSDQLALVVAVDAISWILGIYALVRFRDLLRERYGFHGVDRLIWVVVAAGLLAGIASHAQRYTMSQGAFSLPLMLVVGIVLGVLNGVIGIVFATRLLRVNGSLNGYKKPLAYVYLAGSICFLLVIPSLVGVVLLVAWSILLGLAFFRGEELEELEVV